MIAKYILTSIILLSLLFLNSCSQEELAISEHNYQPKIVIDAVLIPEQNPKDIRITRNFPLNKDLDLSSFFLLNADVRITDVESGESRALTPNLSNFSFEYYGSDFIIEYNRTYKLDVWAEIEGKSLYAYGYTTTPKQGFCVDKTSSILDSMKYRELDEYGNLKNFIIAFNPSEGAAFYAFSITALDASHSTFVYDNPYFEIDSADLAEAFDRYRLQYSWMQDIDVSRSIIKYEINWLDAWFYGSYRAIIYAGDRNYHHFIATYQNVQEIDGNFHEPKFYIEGDGIGLFGSAIVDTVYYKVLKQ